MESADDSEGDSTVKTKRIADRKHKVTGLGSGGASNRARYQSRSLDPENREIGLLVSYDDGCRQTASVGEKCRYRLCALYHVTARQYQATLGVHDHPGTIEIPCYRQWTIRKPLTGASRRVRLQGLRRRRDAYYRWHDLLHQWRESLKRRETAD